jgi:hypothetical protein
LENLAVYGKILKFDGKETGLRDTEWIHLTQKMDQFVAIVNAVMKTEFQ